MMPNGNKPILEEEKKIVKGAMERCRNAVCISTLLRKMNTFEKEKNTSNQLLEKVSKIVKKTNERWISEAEMPWYQPHQPGKSTLLRKKPTPGNKLMKRRRSSPIYRYLSPVLPYHTLHFEKETNQNPKFSNANIHVVQLFLSYVQAK